MGGRVDEGAEGKDVASESPQAAEIEGRTDHVNLAAMLRDAVFKEAKTRCPEIARGLVDGAVEGHIQHFKVIVEMVEDEETSRAAESKTVGRSIASAWGAEPEWQGGTCANCALRAAAA